MFSSLVPATQISPSCRRLPLRRCGVGVRGTAEDRASWVASDPRSRTIALVRRGNCHYSAKVYVAQQAGAAAAIVYNSNAGSTAAMRGGDNAEL